MWQIPRTILLQLAALALLLPLLVVQNPPQLASKPKIHAELNSVFEDPSSAVLFEVKKAEYEPMIAVIRAKKPNNSSTPSPAPTERPVQVAAASIERQSSSAPSDIHMLIQKYAALYGANPDIMTIIARCESGFRPEALSPSGAYAGLYQFVASTWVSNRKAMGLDPNPDLRYNAEEAIKTAAFKMGRDGYGAWPVCSKKAYNALGLAQQ